MKSSIDVQWLNDMKFEANVYGHKVFMDADENSGGHNEGPRPKAFMMVALAGCTGMDVVSILKKMKMAFDHFDLKVEGDINEEHPKKFNKMKIIYTFSGKELDYEKIKKAVDLSFDKYCGVNANYKDSMEMSYDIVIK